MGKQATLKDIARHSGLSIATISRVLSNSDYMVSEGTRQRVLSSAKELNYTPNELGKSLKTRSTRDIGVILPNITNPYFALLLQGVNDEAARQGYHILLCNSHRDSAREAENISILISKRVAGILLSSINPNTNAVQRAIEIGCNVLSLEQPLPLPCPCVGFDYRAGAQMATRHLIDLGHRRIGFIGAPLDRPSRRLMLEGYRDALREAALPETPAFEMLAGVESDRVGIYEIENGGECARSFLAMAERPTGFVCINDMTALGAMRAFAAAGLRIPEDVSIVGFDNIPYCELSAPTLTTIDQRAYELGALALRRLVTKESESAMLAPSLVIRNSTGRAEPCTHMLRQG